MNNEEFIEFEEHELRAFETLRDISAECTLFLKRNNNDFPLNEEENSIGLYGSGVRHTLKGGTGSGNLEIHHFKNIEEAFLTRGVNVTSTKWLKKYDHIFSKRRKAFVKRIKQEAKEAQENPASYCFGQINAEGEYDLSAYLRKDEISIYVISRQAGEGKDKKVVKGDYLLTDTEIRDITFLSENSKKFVLVINSASVIDLTPILGKVDNILLISFLGSLTSEILVDIIYGELNPSGKLSYTWDKYENYPTSENFGDLNNTYYKEGLFVGYRYFATLDKTPLFPFGYGLSYSKFEIQFLSISNVKEEIEVVASVKNISNVKGKEVVQLYLSKPSFIDYNNPKIELVGFTKTSTLDPGEVEEVTINFKLSDFASFDSNRDMYSLIRGIYQLSIGNSSTNLEVVGSIELVQDIDIKKVDKVEEFAFFNEDNIDYVSEYEKCANNIVLTKKDFAPTVIQKYKDFSPEIRKEISSLKDDELILLSIGNISKGINGAIGFSCESVLGGAGETTLNVKSIKKSLTMADGPAGLRIAMDCIKTKRKKYKISLDPMWLDLLNYLPGVAKLVIDTRRNKHKRGEIYHQYTTSIPSSNSIACSFNIDVARQIGYLVGSEMSKYGVDVWLAPAINIIRNPLCGRNFEYFSEDPFLTSEIASEIINAVQSNGVSKVCIKHFACNNQEENRQHSNSVLSVRTLREIYLKTFEKVISNSSPFSIMTAYNLINGLHCSENSVLLGKILRNELGFDGLIMTDWVSTEKSQTSKHIHPSITASNEIKNGVNLVMPGNKLDIADLDDALIKGDISREDLIKNCSFIYSKILEVHND